MGVISDYFLTEPWPEIMLFPNLNDFYLRVPNTGGRKARPYEK
jgi:hypothetical protein